ncbi:MAG: PKD domain-containing protein, partial [Gammaproteobacteria bacterium]
ISLRFTSGGVVTLESAEIVYGFAHGHVGDPQLLDARIVDFNGTVVDRFNAWNPLWAFEVGVSGEERMVVLPEATGLFTFPFRPDIAEMRLTDAETQQELARIDLIPPVHEFCRDNPSDSECANVVNRPPVCDADGPYLAECAGPTTVVDLDGSGSVDPDDDPLTYSWTGPFSGGAASGVSPSVVFSGLGDFALDLTVADDWGGAATCNTTATVQDTTAPEIACNALTTIVPPDAPISFTATATDICGSVTVQITDYDCYGFTKKGKRIDKTHSCEVTLAADTIAIQDSGGVGDIITWTVEAADSSGNRAVNNCTLTVIRP